MGKKQDDSHQNPQVLHTMLDGTVRDSVAGLEIPYNEHTKVAYYIIARSIRGDFSAEFMHTSVKSQMDN